MSQILTLADIHEKVHPGVEVMQSATRTLADGRVILNPNYPGIHEDSTVDFSAGEARALADFLKTRNNYTCEDVKWAHGLCKTLESL